MTLCLLNGRIAKSVTAAKEKISRLLLVSTPILHRERLRWFSISDQTLFLTSISGRTMGRCPPIVRLRSGLWRNFADLVRPTPTLFV